MAIGKDSPDESTSSSGFLVGINKQTDEVDMVTPAILVEKHSTVNASTSLGGGNENFRANYDKIFGKKDEEQN